MKIDCQNSLEQAFKCGINVFVGAGFSTLAKDKHGKTLPLGAELCEELKHKFNKSANVSLPQLATMLEASVKTDFYTYLKDRFTIGTYDPLYKNLSKINVKSYYTTNIDDLIPRIVNDDSLKYLNDQAQNGPSTELQAINYLPLHGSVASSESKYVFDVSSLANIYNDTPRIWSILSKELETHPTIFLGYSFNDSSVIQALTSHQTFKNAQKEIWVLIRNTDRDFAEYYKALGFNLIYGDLTEFLTYLGEFSTNHINQTLDKGRLDLLSAYAVPHSLTELKVQRPIADFLAGSSPQWCDILSNQLYKTHYFSIIQDSVYNPKRHTIIIGAPVSGKTTLMMQVANAITDMGLKLYFNSITVPKAEYISKLIGNDKAVIFIDNLYDSIDALSYLNKPNIKIIGAERSHNYGIISHLLDPQLYQVINVTALNDYDLQGIFNMLPSSIRKENLQRETELGLYDRDSIFEFVIRNVRSHNIKERYTEALKRLEIDDPYLAEFMVLCAYMHSCRIPLSFEVAHNYFDDFDYNEIFNMRDDASDIIKDYIPEDGQKYEDMDYYYPRSTHIAETLMIAASKSTLKFVLNNLIDRVPRIMIPDYKIFRKYAFDKVLISKAFDSWEEGRLFYEKAFLYDNKNPYVLQQGALFLAQKKQFELAFEWIDRAINMTNDRYFSIRNSHAIILFNANIDKTGEDARNELDKSMKILEKCMKADARKRFHANTYGSQAVRYYERFRDKIAEQYLHQAILWLNQEVDVSNWDVDTRCLRDQIQKTIEHIDHNNKCIS